MLRLEARNSQTPIERKPPWIKTRLRTGPAYTELKKLVRREGCTRSARRRAARTSSSAGKTARPRS